MAAKVDNAAVQDGYSLYHHVIFFDQHGDWAIIQQGMNPINRMARRYHWISDNVKSFILVAIREPIVNTDALTMEARMRVRIIMVDFDTWSATFGTDNTTYQLPPDRFALWIIMLALLILVINPCYENLISRSLINPYFINRSSVSGLN
jgi:hypothetical protein